MSNQGKDNLIVKLAFEFALDIVAFCDELEKRHKYRLTSQIFGSGTSIGANVAEAQTAESPKDFLHKMKIAQKEAEETKYWLRLCEFSEVLPTNISLNEKIQSLIQILSRIISSTRSTLQLRQ